jgi:ATP/maltotriose-dependent transcriptional regulator MalT
LRDAALVVVQAPAGYGKTTAAHAALDGGADVAWYDAQPWEAGAFAEALLARVRDVRPDVGRLTLALAEQQADPERLGATLAEELRHVDAPLRIVVDDAHVLGASFAAFARSLVRRMPDPVRVVLLARGPLDVGLPEAVAAGRGVLIEAPALRFDVRAARALAATLGVPLDDARAQTLVERTEGWPIAVALALRAPDASNALLDDLVGRRLEALDDEQRTLLAGAVAYETIEPELVAPGDARYARRLAELAADASLVARASGAFRVHPLVRDLLARRLDAGALAARHAAAAATYAHAGRVRPAMFHLERARDARADAAFLRAHAAAAVESGLADGVRAALGRMRAADLDEPALLSFADGIVLKARGGDGRPAFAIAAQAASARGDDALAFEARLASIEADLAHGEPVTQERIDDLLARAATAGAAALAKAQVRAGWADAIAGRFAQALARVDVPDGGDPALLADVAPLEAYAHVALGDFESGERIANALVEAWSSGDDLMRYSGALVWGARFALLRGDTTAAYELAREAERIARPFELRPQAAALHGTLAEAALHVGDTALARHEARAALRTADAAWYARDAARTRLLAGRIIARADALDGDYAAACRAADALGGDDPLVDADRAIYAGLAGEPDAPERREHARRAIAAAMPVDAADAVWLWAAAELLAAADGRASVTQMRYGPFEALVARRGEVAGRSFEAQMLERLAAPLVAVHATAAAPVLLPLEVLTPREAEILALLAAGLTNREIAQRLVLSARTVETHVARVTGKLGVNSRARAVARAVALGLVDPAAAV